MDVQRNGSGDHLADVAPGARAPLPSDVLEALPGRIVNIYIAIGTTWIIASDLAMGALRDEAFADRVPDMVKGLLFVLGTSLVLFAVARRVARRFDRLFLSTTTAQRDFYGSVLSTSSDIVAIFGLDGRTVFVNDAATELLGWLPEQMVGRPGRDFIHPADRAAAVGFREIAGADEAATLSRTFLLRHRDGSYRAMEVRGAGIRLAGDEVGVVINARDVTDRARSERQLRAALAEDVTGLPDLRMFVAEMEVIEELRPDGLVATIALVDVDRFGDVNELHGRAGGDLVLREIAGRLEAAMPEALGVWRHGADEFAVVVLEDRRDYAPGPLALAERVQAAVEAPVVLDEEGTRVGVELSVGVARVDIGRRADGEGLSAILLRAAEGALADAKSHPDRIAVRLEGGGGRSADRARLVAELHEALAQDQLVVHYQPKVRLQDLRSSGVEALVRWAHPSRGLLAPGEFLGAVAEANLSASVLRVVLHDALGRTVEWLRNPACDPDFTVCVNISADDLRRKRFAEDLFGALDEHGVEPSRLCLELTEQTMLADPTGAREVVDRLRGAGVQVAIDDFGTGYSTLEHIRVFEVDEIKIDKGFVQRLGSSPADEAIVDSVLAITHRIGVRVVAEGIEDPAALAYLRERGCGFGQGYLLQRPVPPDEIDPCRRWDPPGP